MKNIKVIQTIDFKDKVHNISSYLYDLFIPGKDHIDICYDNKADLFIYCYRGQGSYDVASINVPKKKTYRLKKGEVEYISTTEGHHLFGDSLIVNIRDKNRGTIITIMKGSSSGGISVALDSSI